MLSSHYMRLLLRGVMWTAKASSIALWDALKAAAQARLSDTDGGKVWVGSSASGVSVSFQVPAGMSPLAASEAISYLLDLYERIDGATPSPADDDERFTAMMAELQPITSTYSNFSALRVSGEVTQ